MDYGGLSDYPHCQIKLKKYKTSENEQSHGSFFLRVGGLGKELILQLSCWNVWNFLFIDLPRPSSLSFEKFRCPSIHNSVFSPAFGLGTMVYIGLEFGSWFEVPWDSPCYQAVRGVNPVLQLIFTFSQMYFVFMNSRVSLINPSSLSLKSPKPWTQDLAACLAQLWNYIRVFHRPR